MLYLLSFLILFLAEMFNTLHSISTVKNKKYSVALFGGISTALWCIKIIVIINQPLTIITAFIGAYIGSLSAFYLDKRYKK